MKKRFDSKYVICMFLDSQVRDWGTSISHHTLSRMTQVFLNNKKLWDAEVHDSTYLKFFHSRTKESKLVPIFVTDSTRSIHDQEGWQPKLRLDKVSDDEYLYRMWRKCCQQTEMAFRSYVELGKQHGFFTIVDGYIKETRGDDIDYTFFYDGKYRVGKFYTLLKVGLENCRITSHEDYVKWTNYDVDEKKRQKFMNLDESMFPIISQISRAYMRNLKAARGARFYLERLTKALEVKLGIRNKNNNSFSYDHVVIHNINDHVWIWRPDTGYYRGEGPTRYELVIEGKFSAPQAVINTTPAN